MLMRPDGHVGRKAAESSDARSINVEDVRSIVAGKRRYAAPKTAGAPDGQVEVSEAGFTGNLAGVCL